MNNKYKQKVISLVDRWVLSRETQDEVDSPRSGFRVSIRAVLWLSSSLPHSAIICQPQMSVVGDHIVLKKKNNNNHPVFFKINLFQLQLICPLQRQVNNMKASSSKVWESRVSGHWASFFLDSSWSSVTLKDNMEMKRDQAAEVKIQSRASWPAFPAEALC